MIRVLVVDDNAAFRRALVSLLEQQPDLEVVGTAGSLSEGRTVLKGVDVALLDRGLPDDEPRRQGVCDQLDCGGDPPEGCDGGRSGRGDRQV
jgi:DNA-binding NarL/FixJ family response regulator